MSSQPRPPVEVSRATTCALTMTIGETGASNAIRAVRLGAGGRSPSNAVVDIAGGPSGLRGEATYAPPAPTSQVRLTIRRETPGLATTVPLVVTDACGTWETVVGGGTGAGF